MVEGYISFFLTVIIFWGDIRHRKIIARIYFCEKGGIEK